MVNLHAQYFIPGNDSGWQETDPVLIRLSMVRAKTEYSTSPTGLQGNRGNPFFPGRLVRDRSSWQRGGCQVRMVEPLLFEGLVKHVVQGDPRCVKTPAFRQGKALFDTFSLNGRELLPDLVVQPDSSIHSVCLLDSKDPVPSMESQLFAASSSSLRSRVLSHILIIQCNIRALKHHGMQYRRSHIQRTMAIHAGT